MKAGDLYPWMLHKAGAQTIVVNGPDEKAAAEAEGWCVNPPDQQPPPPPPPETAPVPAAPAPAGEPPPRRRR